MKYFDYNEILTDDIKNRIKKEYESKVNEKRKYFILSFIIGIVLFVIGINILFLNLIFIVKLSLSILFFILGGCLIILFSFFPLVYPKKIKKAYFYNRLKKLGYVDLIE